MSRNLVYALIISFCLCTGAFAAGVANNTIGLQESERCSFVGIANDSSSVAHNPAGLTNIPEGKFDAEVCVLYNFTKFTYEDTTGREHVSDEPIILPSVFAAKSMGNIAFGFGVYCANGTGEMKYSNVPLIMSLSGNNINTSTDVHGETYSLCFSPAIAYKILPNLSLGLTIETFYGKSYAKYVVDTLDVPMSGGNMKTDEKTDGFGGVDAKLGLFAKLTNELSLGLLIKTPAKLKTKGTRKTEYNSVLEALPLPEPLRDKKEDVKITERVPWYFMSGIGYKFLSNLDASLDFGYRLWSKYQKTVKVAGAEEASSSVNTNTLKDAYVVGCGVKYGIISDLNVTAGFMYVPTAKRDKDVKFAETDFDQTLTSLSVAYKVIQEFEIHLGCSYVHSIDKRDVPAGNLGGGGKVDSNTIYILGGVRGVF
ncbi:MAG: outer membrane protein transport protein [Spirochaetota bacterium]